MAPGGRADLAEMPSVSGTNPELVLLSACRACYGVLRFIMESGAKGCEVVVSGKLRGQRAKSMKFVDGLMIHSGDPVNYYVDTAVRHVLLRQGEWPGCGSLRGSGGFCSKCFGARRSQLQVFRACGSEIFLSCEVAARF